MLLHYSFAAALARPEGSRSRFRALPSIPTRLTLEVMKFTERI
jgi:hypothetical protein